MSSIYSVFSVDNAGHYKYVFELVEDIYRYIIIYNKQLNIYYVYTYYI